MIETIQPYLQVLLPILVVPLGMRLIIAPIILFILKKKYIKDITSTIKEGWVDERDIEAVEYLKNHAWKGLRTPFVISYNITYLEAQLKTLFIEITRIYNKESNGKINLKFSIQKVMESLYLIFEDLHKDLSKLRIYRLLEKLPLSIFLRVTKLNKYIKVVTQNKIMIILKKYRISTKVIRLILTPIIGFPIIISQLILSLLYATVFEGYLRFIYGIILIKVGYYTIYLYSSRESSLHNRIDFNKKEIGIRGKFIEENYTQFKQREQFTKSLKPALDTLKNELQNMNIMHNKETSIDNGKFDRIKHRITNVIKNTINSELNGEHTNPFSIKPLLNISKKIGNVYFPNTEQPFFQLRVKEFLEFGYFLTTLSLKNIYTIPGTSLLLDKIPLKLALDINDFIDDNNLKKHIPNIKKSGKFIKSIKSYYTTSKFIAKKSHPLILVTSMVTPILMQQAQDGIKEYIYNITGLLLIDSYETTLLKNKKSKINTLYN